MSDTPIDPEQIRESDRWRDAQHLMSAPSLSGHPDGSDCCQDCGTWTVECCRRCYRLRILRIASEIQALYDDGPQYEPGYVDLEDVLRVVRGEAGT